MKVKVHITDLERYGDHGWSWTVDADDPYALPEQWGGTRYRTNGEGDGLWVVGELEDKQVSGTCQFSLPAKKSAARSKLYREFPGGEYPD